MSIMIELPEHVEALLRADAAAAGQDVATVAAERILAWYSASAPLPGKPLRQFMEEQRKKHGFPDNWGTGKKPLSEAEWQVIDDAQTDAVDDPIP